MLTILEKPAPVKAYKTGAARSLPMDSVPVPTTSLLYRFEKGTKAFSIMFRRWMEECGWSHPRLVRATEIATQQSWLHSSQIAGLVSGKLTGPGPRIFIALAEVNKLIARIEAGEAPSHANMTLFKGTKAMRNPDGTVMDFNDLLNVFVGITERPEVDSYNPEEAARITRGMAKVVRAWFIDNQKDLVDDIELFTDLYQAESPEVERRLTRVLWGNASYTPDEVREQAARFAQVLTALGMEISTEDLVHKALSTR
jgi:hypothetical protein